MPQPLKSGGPWAIALTRTVAGVPSGLSPYGSQAKPLIDYRKENKRGD